MAIYRNCVCVELEKLASSLKCRRALSRHPFINTAGVVLIMVTAVTNSKPQHCWCCSGTQVSASKKQLAASVTQFFCCVYRALWVVAPRENPALTAHFATNKTKLKWLIYFFIACRYILLRNQNFQSFNVFIPTRLLS